MIVNHPDDVWIYDLRNVVGTSIDGERLYGNQPNSLDAMREFPVEERREINRSGGQCLVKVGAGATAAIETAMIY